MSTREKLWACGACGVCVRVFAISVARHVYARDKPCDSFSPGHVLCLPSTVQHACTHIPCELIGRNTVISGAHGHARTGELECVACLLLNRRAEQILCDVFAGGDLDAELLRQFRARVYRAVADVETPPRLIVPNARADEIMHDIWQQTRNDRIDVSSIAIDVNVLLLVKR